MDRFAGIRAFVTVANLGGFSAAGRALGLSTPAISKQVSALEARLGVRLLQRSTRQVVLTDIGREMQDRYGRAFAELEEAERLAAERRDRPSGRLRVNAPLGFGELHLGPATVDFVRAHPEVELDLTLEDRFVDVLAEGFDVVVRIARLADSALVARRIAPCACVLCASPAYLAKHGEPRVPADLAPHECLGYSYSATRGEWPFRGTGDAGSIHRMRVSGRFRSNNGQVLRELALAGVGIALLPSFYVGEDLRTGRLRTVLDGHLDADLAIHAIHPHRRHVPRAVRAFVDFLVERFRHPPWESVTLAPTARRPRRRR